MTGSRTTRESVTSTVNAPSTARPEPGDRSPETFTALAAPLRPELLAHCYRMLGSATEAEDRVQEAYLRAWQAFHAFDGRSSVRTWMYKIATNTCLSALTSASRRVLPTGLGQGPGDPRADLVSRDDLAWVEPLPDRVLWQGAAPDPAEASVAREGVGLAFVAAVQLLPPRQRAVLVLREVLRFSAAETAEHLDITVAAVNSALQRARAAVGDVEPESLPALSPQDEQAVADFVAAFEAHDLARLTDVLTSDLVWQMPPFDRWYSGVQDAIDLSATHCPAAAADDLAFLAARANGRPALGMYLRDESGYARFHFQVLDVRDGRIEAVTGYFGDGVFDAAGLPHRLPPID